MKAVLISIRPEWCVKIAKGEKTIEVRKTRPKLEAPFKCYIYCTKGCALIYCRPSQRFGNGKVIGEFVCDRFDTFLPAANLYLYVCISNSDPDVYRQTCLGKDGFAQYGKGKRLYGWHISDLKIYDEPKSMQDFTGLRKTKFGYAPYELTRPPQSWCYVKEEKK